MKNKFLKYFLITLGAGAIAYGSWRITEYFLGIVRLNYAKIKIVKYDQPVDESPLEE
jgi:hypothetical protein